MRIVYIYGLWDPRDGRLRYIGKTVNTRNRLARHIRETKKKGPTTHLRSWVTGILKENEKPMLEILEETTEADWETVERDWIRQCRESGIDLVNLCDGGEGGAYKGHKTSESTKQKMREYWADPEWRARTIEASKEGKQRAAESRGGHQWTPEGLVSFKEKRKTWSPGLGKVKSAEARAKIGAANAIALKGRPLSRKAIEAGHKARWTEEERERWSQVANKKPRGPDGRFLPEGDG